MTDKLTGRIVVVILGLIGLAVVAGGIFLASDDKALPGELIALGGSAVGAIAGLVAPSFTGLSSGK